MKRKLNVHLFLAVILVLFGIGLIVAAFAVPPTGVIDPTVLTAYGETLTFVGALMGLDYHYRYRDLVPPPRDGADRMPYAGRSPE